MNRAKHVFEIAVLLCFLALIVWMSMQVIPDIIHDLLKGGF